MNSKANDHVSYMIMTQSKRSLNWKFTIIGGKYTIFRLKLSTPTIITLKINDHKNFTIIGTVKRVEIFEDRILSKV